MGAGNLAHVWAGLLGARSGRRRVDRLFLFSSCKLDVRVSLLSRKAAKIAECATKTGIAVTVKSSNGDKVVTGKCHRVSASAADVIPDGNILSALVVSSNSVLQRTSLL